MVGTENPVRVLTVFALMIFLMLVMIWGLLWPAMKIGVAEIPILTFRAVGSLLAVFVMLGLTIAAGHSLRVPKGKMVPLAIGGLFGLLVALTRWQSKLNS